MMNGKLFKNVVVFGRVERTPTIRHNTGI